MSWEPGVAGSLPLGFTENLPMQEGTVADTMLKQPPMAGNSTPQRHSNDYDLLQQGTLPSPDGVEMSCTGALIAGTTRESHLAKVKPMD